MKGGRPSSIPCCLHPLVFVVPICQFHLRWERGRSHRRNYSIRPLGGGKSFYLFCVDSCTDGAVSLIILLTRDVLLVWSFFVFSGSRRCPWGGCPTLNSRTPPPLLLVAKIETPNCGKEREYRKHTTYADTTAGGRTTNQKQKLHIQRVTWKTRSSSAMREA